MPTILTSTEPADGRAWPPPAPASALSCPRCVAPAQASPEPQKCACGQRFVLRTGILLDPSVSLPPAEPRPPTISVKSTGLLLRRYAALEPEGIVEGALDPITGHVPMTNDRLSFRAVYSVAVWRRIPIATAVLLFLIPVPLFLAALVATLGSGEPFIVGVFFLAPMTALTAWGLWSTFGIRANWARVVSTKGDLLIRFDSPSWRRKRFHQELLRRCGISESPIP